APTGARTHMKCDQVQNDLLNSERPDRPGAEMRLHLAGCDDCRALYNRLVDAERALSQLAVPPSTRRDDFVGQVLRGDIVMPPSVPLSLLRPGRSAKERGLQKLAAAIALAAGLLVFAVGWWALPRNNQNLLALPDPLTLRQQERDRRLAAAQTP